MLAVEQLEDRCLPSLISALLSDEQIILPMPIEHKCIKRHESNFKDKPTMGGCTSPWIYPNDEQSQHTHDPLPKSKHHEWPDDKEWPEMPQYSVVPLPYLKH